jgi:putative lipoprotein
MAAETVLSGTVVYRERMALPPDAVVEVKLVDVSRADAPAEVIAQTQLQAGPGVPIPWQLSFDRARILPGRSYALQARIADGDRLLFINTTRHAIFAGGTANTEIRVQHVAGQTEALSPAGRWLAEDIRGGGVIDYLQSVLEIDQAGKVSGTGGCNGIMGQATVKGTAISFGRLASTMMACTPAAMDQERKFIAALEDSRSFELIPQERKLILLDADGKLAMRLAAM